MKSFVLAMRVALLLSLCLGCNHADKKSGYADETQKSAVPSVASGAVAADSAMTVDDKEYEQSPKKDESGKPAGGKTTAAPAANPDWDKKIVKTADLSLEVKNFSLFTRRLHQVVKQAGGYIAQEEMRQSTTEISNTVTIKVPVAGFDDLLLQLPTDSERLVDKKISSQDVTMEVIDTKSRLETKKEVRERYLELLHRRIT